MGKTTEKSAAAGSADVDAYLVTLPAEQRTVLSTLRDRIKAAAPAATEAIGYGVPMFTYLGRPLFGIGAAKAHCALYGYNEGIRPLVPELDRFDLSKGTIRFTPEKPLPAAVVKKIVKARMAEIEARGPRRT